MIKDFPRDKIKITSKWGAKFTPQGLTKDLRMEACREQCEGSLKRMGVDYLDMFIFRGPPKDEYGTTMEQCVENMKVLFPLQRFHVKAAESMCTCQHKLFREVSGLQYTS